MGVTELALHLQWESRIDFAGFLSTKCYVSDQVRPAARN